MAWSEKNTLKSLALMALPAVYALPAAAGSVVTMESRDLTTSPAEVSTVSIFSEGDAMRMDTAGTMPGDATSVIFDTTAKVMTTIDHNEREYFVIDEAAVQGIAGQMSDVMQQMQDALKDLPPEQRAMAEQMMKQRMGSMGQSAPAEKRTQVQKTGETATVNGYRCEVYALLESGRKVRDMCVTDWSNVDGGRQFQENVKNMSAFFKDLRSAYEESGFNLGSSGDAMSFMDDIDGFPARVREYEGETIVEETTLVSSESEALAAERFQVPDGYSRQSMGR